MMLGIGLEIILAVCSQERQTSNSGFPTSKLAVQERYNQKMRLSVSSYSLQGIAERPLPCNYNVIQPVSALSRRKRGFKSRRGRQINRLGEQRLLSV